MIARTRAVAIACAVLTLAACGKKDAANDTANMPPAAPPAALPDPTLATVQVAEVNTGRSVGTDKRVLAPVTTFAASDTIFASVRTSGAAPSATLVARWTFQDGQVIDERSETIAPTGDAWTVFHITKPGGWPKGKYTLKVLLNGAEVQTREVEVR